MDLRTPRQCLQRAIATAVNELWHRDLAPNQIEIEIAPQYATEYTCAIALVLANSLPSSTPIAIATAIAAHCLQNQDFAAKFAITPIGKGWLNIAINTNYRLEILCALDYWLLEERDCFPCQNLSNLLDDSAYDSAYVYARCCALLRLAARENLPHSKPAILKMEPAEIILFLRNLAIADYLRSPHLDPSGNPSHQINQLSLNQLNQLRRSLVAAFLDFYRQCRIFGVSPEIAQSRIYLIRITQKLIKAIAPSPTTYLPYL